MPKQSPRVLGIYYNRRIHTPRGQLTVVSCRQHIYDPLDHYDYSFIDKECCCDICEDWRRADSHLKSFGIANSRCLPGSAYTNGVTFQGNELPYDPKAREWITARSIFLAANNRRELYCESSFHASCEENRWEARKFMDWLKELIQDRTSRTDGWWEVRAITIPLGYWQALYRYQRAGVDFKRMEAMLSEEFDYAMPSDTVQALMAVSGMVRNSVSGVAI